MASGFTKPVFSMRSVMGFEHVESSFEPNSVRSSPSSRSTFSHINVYRSEFTLSICVRAVDIAHVGYLRRHARSVDGQTRRVALRDHVDNRHSILKMT